MEVHNTTTENQILNNIESQTENQSPILENNLETHTENITNEHPEIHEENVESSHNEEHEGHFEHAISLASEPIINTPFYQITNSVFTSVIVSVFVFFIVLFLKKDKNPKRFQSFFEIVLNGALDLCDQVTGDRKLSKKVLPLALSIFFFVLLNNWLGILPLTWFGVIQHGAFVPFIRGGTADLNTTLTLGLITVLGANIFGAMTIGLGKTINKYLNFTSFVKAFKNIKKEPTGLIVAPITFFVGLIEIVGEVAKIASLSFRLFGNIFAGEVLLVSMAALVKFLIPTPFLVLEVFVGVIQAVIFSMLTLVYFTIASHDHDHDEEHSHEKHEDLSVSEALEHSIEEIEDSIDNKKELKNS
jgi:F-type H+-transporting ATPase subunit a